MKQRFGLWLIALLTVLMAFSSFAFATPSESGNLQIAESEEAKETSPKTDRQGRPIMPSDSTAVLAEQNSGTVLYESQGSKRVFPASTTKVMTCLLAVEAIDRGELRLEETVTVTEEMLDGLDPDGTNMALKAGEELTVQHLLWGLMIPSGNDAAMVLAFRISGSAEAFAEQMNARAAELGCTDTHFVNPHGLHDENHYTTALDMAKIAQKGMEYAVFRDIVDIAHIKIPPTNLSEERYYINTNGLISTMRYRDYAYKGATGIKTGSTTQAGACLVSSATRNGMALIGVFFHGKDVTESHTETARLFDWGFANFEAIRGVAKGELLGESKVKRAGGKDTVTLAAAEDVTVVVPKGTQKSDLEIRQDLPEKLYAPLKEGQDAAGVTVLYQGQELGHGRLVALTEVKRSFFWPLMALGEWLWGFALIRGICYLVLALVAVFFLLLIRNLYREAKRANRRNRRRRNYRR